MSTNFFLVHAHTSLIGVKKSNWYGFIFFTHKHFEDTDAFLSRRWFSNLLVQLHETQNQIKNQTKSFFSRFQMKMKNGTKKNLLKKGK